MRPAQALVCLAAVLPPAACTATAGPDLVPGIVTGRLTIEGGPLGPGDRQPGTRPIPGTVQFISGQGRRITIRVSGSGRFSVRLPAGRYLVSDRSPRLLLVGADGIGRQTWSRPMPVTVSPQHTTKITLTNVVP